MIFVTCFYLRIAARRWRLDRVGVRDRQGEVQTLFSGQKVLYSLGGNI